MSSGEKIKIMILAFCASVYFNLFVWGKDIPGLVTLITKLIAYVGPTCYCLLPLFCLTVWYAIIDSPPLKYLVLLSNSSGQLGFAGTIIGVTVALGSVGSIETVKASLQGLSSACYSTIMGLGISLICQSIFTYWERGTNE